MFQLYIGTGIFPSFELRDFCIAGRMSDPVLILPKFNEEQSITFCLQTSCLRSYADELWQYKRFSNYFFLW